MNDSSRRRPPIVLIVTVIALAVYAGLLWYQLGTTQDALRQAQAREARLLEQLQALAMMPGRGRDSAQEAGTEAVAVALLQRPDLIELDPASGGRYYFLEDSVRILSDRYAYAAFENGEVSGHALVEYRDGADGGITVNLVDAYLNR